MKNLTLKFILATASLCMLCQVLQAENSALSFSKFSEALKQGKEAAKTKFVHDLEDPWPEQLNEEHGRRQPSQQGLLGQSLQIQVAKYKKEVEKQSIKKTPPPPEKNLRVPPEKKIIKSEVKKEEIKKITTPPKVKRVPPGKTPVKIRKETQIDSAKRSNRLSERYEKMGKETKPSPSMPIDKKAKKEAPAKPIVKKDAPAKPNAKKETPAKPKPKETSKPKSSLNFEVVDGNKNQKSKSNSKRTQKTESKPTKIKHFKY